jgi:hypothetical protein
LAPRGICRMACPQKTPTTTPRSSTASYQRVAQTSKHGSLAFHRPARRALDRRMLIRAVSPTIHQRSNPNRPIPGSLSASLGGVDADIEPQDVSSNPSSTARRRPARP